MFRVLAGCFAVAALAVVTAANGSSASWHVIKSKTAHGDFAVTAVSATVGHSHGIAVRVSGGDAQGFVAWACSRGFSVSSYSRDVRGFRVLPHASGASCNITLSGSGDGYVKVQIFRW